jgi:hypothetical protein
MIGKNSILPALFTSTPVRPRPVSAETYTLHFRTAQSLILIDAAVNGLPAKLLFDTGSTRTILSAEVLGLNPAKIEMQPQESPYSPQGENSLETYISLILDRYELARARVLAADLTDIRKQLRVRCDGIIGQDLIGTFNSVRIDYAQNIVQLEK